METNVLIKRMAIAVSLSILILGGLVYKINGYRKARALDLYWNLDKVQ
jgi:hypothetical protein